MVLVQGGVFQMGSHEKNKDTEKPVHEVRVSDFYIGKYLVTFEEYELFCIQTGRPKPADYQRERLGRAVCGVSWHEAVAYTDWLTQQLGAIYRLPTEAEWEFAAQGGIHSKHYRYAGSDDLNEVGWYEGNSWAVTPEQFFTGEFTPPRAWVKRSRTSWGFTI